MMPEITIRRQIHADLNTREIKGHPSSNVSSIFLEGEGSKPIHTSNSERRHHGWRRPTGEIFKICASK